MSVHMSIFMSIFMSIHMSIHMSTHMSIQMSMHIMHTVVRSPPALKPANPILDVFRPHSLALDLSFFFMLCCVKDDNPNSKASEFGIQS